MKPDLPPAIATAAEAEGKTVYDKIVLVLAMGLRQMLAIAHFRERFDGFWLTLPIVGRLARGYNNRQREPEAIEPLAEM
eukprot:gene3700-4747_t